MTSDDEGLTIKADLIIKGGEVFDPTKQAFSQQDIAIGQGKVLRMAPSLVGPPDACVIHATGKIVTPGLIDAHVHAFPLGHLIGIDVDPLSSRSGVTTFVDAGSTGSLNFLAFRKYVIERVRSNLFALLNVSAIGEAVRGIRGMDMYESDDLRFLHLPSAIELIEGNLHIIVGVKVRVYTGLPSLLPLSAARELADEVGLPLVVHLAPSPPSFSEVLPYLRPGDYVTHIYHPGPGAIVDQRGRVKSEYKEARERGVLMDTGMDRACTSFPIAQAALDQGFVPDTITTDVTVLDINDQVIDLPTTLSKFMALGMSVVDVLVRATIAPAVLLPPGRGYGRLLEGMPADLAVFSVEEGQLTYQDYFGHSIQGTKRLVPQITIKDGVVLTPEPQPQLNWGFLMK